MHSKLQKKTVGPAICRRSWKFCSTVRTKALTKTPPPFPQPSCALLSRVNSRVLLGTAPRVTADINVPDARRKQGSFFRSGDKPRHELARRALPKWRTVGLLM